MPSLYILAGANGAGKSTVGPSFLPNSPLLIPFDGDKLKMIKQREFYLQVKSYKEAGKMADEFVFAEFDRLYKTALVDRADFAYEGHFTEEESWNIIQTFKEQGYQTIMYFLGIDSLEISNDRVAIRAESGGHNVHPSDIERNFYGNMAMLNKHYKILDELVLIDASEKHRTLAIREENIIHPSVTAEQVPQWVIKYLPAIAFEGWKIKEKLLVKNRIRNSRGKRL